MYLVALLLTLGIKTVQTTVLLSPSPNITVAEHSDAVLNCSSSRTPQIVLVNGKSGEPHEEYGTIKDLNVFSECDTSIEVSDNSYVPVNTMVSCSADKKSFTIRMPNVNNTFHGFYYQCGFLFSNGTLSTNEVSIYVKVPVKYVNISGSFMDVVENRPSNFTCTTSKERPRSTIQWYITNMNDALPGGSVLPTDNDVLAMTVSILSYQFDRHDAESALYCTAMSIGGREKVKSSEEKILVKYATDGGPSIVHFANGSVYTLIESDLQILTCIIAGGYPKPSLKWDCYSGNVTDVSVSGEVRKNVNWSTSDRKNGICTCSAEHEISGKMFVFLITNVQYPPSVPQFSANETAFTDTLLEIQGRSVVIDCDSSSNPSPNKYKWTTSASVPESDLSTIKLQNLQLSNEGIYTCTVTNTMTPSFGGQKDGSSKANFTLELLYPPKPPTLMFSTSQLIGGVLKVIKADDVVVVCNSSGKPSPSYLWTGLSNSNNRRLIINKIHTTNAGMYFCTASNNMNPTVGKNTGGSAKTNLTIIVMRPPSNISLTYLRQNAEPIYLRSDDLKVLKGSTFSLQCTASDGVPDPSYSWSGPGLFTDDTVLFTKVDVTRKGKYMCNATNIMDRTNGSREIGRLLRAISLDILYEPVIEEIEEQIFEENEAVLVQCIATSNPPPSTYRWRRSKDDFQRTSLNLTFEHVNRNDADVYNCSVTNTMQPTDEQTSIIGLGSTTVKLKVLYHPDVAISQLNGTILREGDENIIFLCSADGEPTNYTFENWSQYAPDGITKIKEYRAEKYGNGTVSLTFPNSSYMDSGIFICNVSNGISDKNGLSYAITNTTQKVKGKPVVTNRDLDAIAAVLDNSTLEVSFYSNDETAPTVQWYKTETGSRLEIWNNGSRMFHKTKPDQVIVMFYSVPFLQPGTTSQLFIQNVTEDDFSEYEVVITNTIGPTVTTIQLKPKGPPNCPDKFEIEESTVTSSTITVTWVSGFYGGANQTFHVDYKTSTSLWRDGATVKGFTLKDELFNATLGNLSSGTEYHFRIYAESIYGRSKCNLTKTARTMSDANDTVTSFNVGLIAGGAAGGIVLAAIVVVMVLLFLRRRRDYLKSPSKGLLKDNARPYDSNGADDTPEINVNPMYEPAGPLPSTSNNSDVYSQVDKNRKKTKLDGDIYSQVEKPKRRQKTGGSEVKNDVYAQIQKKSHKEKDPDKTKHKKQKPDKKTKKERQTEGDVYDNVNTLNDTVTKGDTVYENPSCSIEDEHPKQMRNQEGLIYADLDLPKETVGKGRKVVIHGLDDKTDYADIKYGEVGEQAAESDEENTKIQ